MQKTVNYKKAAAVIIVICSMASARAQLASFGSGYFQNRYLLNPAMAGGQTGLTINGAYRKEQLSFAESPTSQYLTADYGLTDKVGLGLKVEAIQSGPLSHIDAKATYAYHVQFTETKKLYMGLSLGITNNHLNISKTNGEADDPALANFNAKGTQVDADFGIAYTDGKLLVQGAMPGIISQYKKEASDWVNKPLAFASVSYKAKLSDDGEGIFAEPMLCFRAIKGNDNMIDAGANFSFLDNKLNIMGMYHTNKSVSAGAGLEIFEKIISINAIYHSTPGDLKTFSDGGIEIALRASLGNIFKKK
jgi:type IX secretion system PorP/SprF family membrane protein